MDGNSSIVSCCHTLYPDPLDAAIGTFAVVKEEASIIESSSCNMTTRQCAFLHSIHSARSSFSSGTAISSPSIMNAPAKFCMGLILIHDDYSRYHGTFLLLVKLASSWTFLLFRQLLCDFTNNTQHSSGSCCHAVEHA